MATHSKSKTQVPTMAVLALHPPFNKTNQPAGDAWDSDVVSRDVCSNLTGSGSTIPFWGLIALGYLNLDGTSLAVLIIYLTAVARFVFVISASSSL